MICVVVGPLSAQDRSGDLLVTVVDDEDVPLGGVPLSVTSSEVTGMTGQTDDRGEFRFDGLPRGRYTIRAESPGFMPQDRQLVEVRRGRATRVTIWMVTASASEMSAVRGADWIGRGDSPTSGLHRPWIHPLMSKPVRSKLETAIELAEGRVRDREQCHDLFVEIGTDGMETLDRTMYFSASPFKESEVCQRATAYTYLGGSVTRLCRRFATLSDEQAAAVLIHEALHHAGLPDRVPSVEGISPRSIDRMIQSNCGL
jgi:hypothetical protein